MHSYFRQKTLGENKRARTRSALIDSAIEIFARHGLGAAKISDITTQAGLANGTFYNHFRDKDELASETTAAVAREIAEAVDDAMADVEDPSLRIVVGGSRFVRIAVENAAWGTILLEWLQRTFHQQVEMAAYPRSDIEKGIREGLFDVELDDYLMEQIGALIAASLRRQLATGPDDVISERTAQNVLRILGFTPARATRTVERARKYLQQ